MKYLISFLFLALAFSMKSEAKVTLPSILGDNMVLQQQAEVKLWGKARPNATVTVKTSWNGLIGWQGRLVVNCIYPCCGRPLQDHLQ